MQIIHEDGAENTTLVLDRYEAYCLGLIIIHARDHGYDFAMEGDTKSPQFVDYALAQLKPVPGSKDYELAYGKSNEVS